MVWFKMDDSFPSHPKVLAIPRRDRLAAVGLWTLAGGWCAKQLTDGYLAKHMLEEIGGTSRLASTLVEVGLWEVSEDGYQYHDWADYNPTREEVESERETARERMKRVRSRRSSGEVQRSSGEVRANNSRSSEEVRSTRPDPTRPEVPDGTSSGAPEAVEETPPAAKMPRSRGTGTRIPDPFIVDEAMRDWAVDRGFTPEWCVAQTERFVNYWTAKPGKDGTKSDWRATWRNWLLKAADDLPPYSGQAANRSPQSGLFDRAMERATQQRLEIVQ